MAVDYYIRGVNSNQLDSMHRFAELINEGKINEDKKMALKLCKTGSDMNHPPSMYEYAKMLEKTKNKTNMNKAYSLFEKASGYNYPNAMFKYAQILEENCMIKKDRLKAIDLYKSSKFKST